MAHLSAFHWSLYLWPLFKCLLGSSSPYSKEDGFLGSELSLGFILNLNLEQKASEFCQSWASKAVGGWMTW